MDKDNTYEDAVATGAAILYEQLENIFCGMDLCSGQAIGTTAKIALRNVLEVAWLNFTLILHEKRWYHQRARVAIRTIRIEGTNQTGTFTKVTPISSDDQAQTPVKKLVSAKKPKIKFGAVNVIHPSNNIAPDFQKDQLQKIVIFDILAMTSHDKILDRLKLWGQVIKILFITVFKNM
ncbi:hypothetical protein GLOIN_2v1653024 [Rhizophagus clarus]|uniref:Uncharacterized protein n=1 Tax=Rhizophagus clarus TaxID=94130 RepID=A0A8H3M8P9_9GLOM|nr:hypothetical protein GLOIN_2v1653024 [Rhizophagus clarus]